MHGRCLIVANQTLGGEALERAIRDCIGRGFNSFFVVVPLIAVDDEVAEWAGGFSSGAWAVPDEPTSQGRTGPDDAEASEERQRAQHRLALILARIQPLEVEADGTVGTDDPLNAARECLDRHGPFDEIIVSTLPGGLSRWLKMDLPSRVDALSDAPVTMIEAEAS